MTVGGLPLALVLYYYLGGMGNHPNDAADTVFWACLLGFPFINFSRSSKRLKKINAAYAELASRAKAALSHPNYYNIGEIGGIAVDVSNKPIAVVSASDNFEVKEAFVFNMNKIKTYKAFSLGRTVIDTSNLSGAQTINASFKNDAAQTTAMNKTGLYFDLDDINNPRVFAQMPFDEADKWMLSIDITPLTLMAPMGRTETVK